MSRPRKAYYVKRPIRGYTHYLVFAESAEDALDRYLDDGDEIDSIVNGYGRGTARRATREDQVEDEPS